MSAARALQAAVAVEHEVIYGYGVAGAHMSGPARAACLRRLDEHLALRDRMAALVHATGAVAVAGRPAYAMPFPVTSKASAYELAVHLEDGAAGAGWDVVAASAAVSAARRLGVTALGAAAVWAARWRSVTTAPVEPALPGKP